MDIAKEGREADYLLQRQYPGQYVVFFDALYSDVATRRLHMQRIIVAASSDLGITSKIVNSLPPQEQDRIRYAYIDEVPMVHDVRNAA